MDAWICGYYFNRLSINQVCDMLFHDVSYTAKSVGRGFNCPLLLNYVKKIGERVRPCTFHLSLTGNACSFTSCFIFFLHTSLESTSLLCLCLRILADA